MPKLSASSVSFLALNANAQAESGAKLYVYLTGTSTPVTTYSDEDMATAHAWPVIANSAGKFPTIYVPAGAYKIDITDADGTSLPGYPEDNVFFGEGATFATVTEMLASSAGYGGLFTAGSYVRTRKEGFAYEVAASGASDHHLTTAGGVRLYVKPLAGDYILSAFNPQSNAKVAWKAAIETLTAGTRLIVDQPISVDFSAWSEVPKMPDDAYIVWRAPVTLETFGVPCLWHENDATDGEVTLENPWFKYSATATAVRPQIMQDFYDNSWTATAPYSNSAQAALLFCRGTTININGTFRAEATDFSAPENLIHCALVLLRGKNGEAGNIYGGDFFFDGILFGILATGFDDFIIGDVHSDRWSQLDTTVFTWEAPGHVWYLTSDANGEYNIKIGDCHDRGREVGTPYVTGAGSYKCSRGSGSFQCGTLWSARSQGLCDLETKNAKLSGGFWDGSGSTTAKLATAKAARLADFNDGGPDRADFGTFYFSMPSDYNDYIQVDATRAVGTFVFDIPGTSLGNVSLIQGEMNGCVFDMVLQMPQTQTATSPSLARFDNGGSNNLLRCAARTPQFAKLRCISADKSTSSGNTAILTDAQTGSTRRISGLHEHRQMTVSTLLSGVSGATVTATSLIPKGANLTGLATYVATTLGTSNGTTGYQVGDAVDADMYGVNATTSGGTEDEDWTADGSGWSGSARSVILTATGGNFDGTGDVRVTAAYTLSLHEGNLI